MKVVSSPFFNANQQIPKINPVSTQLLQTLNRDPRLRKVENSMKTSPTLDDVKQSVLKSKEDKKFDKPKRDCNKHRDSKRKERSPSRSPSKKDLSRKSHKKIDRKERSPRDDKHHKRKDEKKNKDLEVKKKSIMSSGKVQQNEILTINYDILLKDEKSIKDEPKIDNLVTNIPIIEPIETNVPKEKDLVMDVVNDIEMDNSANIPSELTKTDSPLEDSDSLKRLRMYMSTMKKSPEPSPTLPLELKNGSDVHAVNTNQSKIKMSDQLYFIIKFIVGHLLLFLNKLDTILCHNKMKKKFTLPLSPV